MKVIVFLTEPASYTIDLVKKVYSPNNIDYKFLKKSSYSYPYKSKNIKNKLFINNYSFISKLSLIKKCYIKYDAIILNMISVFYLVCIL